MHWLDFPALWAPLRSEWLLADGPDWVAIDKPTDIACPHGTESLEPCTDLERATPAVRNDLFSRLRIYWHEAGLSVAAQPLHHVFDPLDGQMGPTAGAGSAVSGVCIVARRHDVAEALVQHELQGRVRLIHVVGVQGWPGDLVHEREHKDRLLHALATLGIQLRSARKVRSRALLTLHHASGRRLDLRRELARLGLHLAGPRSDGTASDLDPSVTPLAPRLMLHRATVDMPFAVLEAPLPPAFARWLADDDAETLDERLDAALRRRFVLGRSQETTAFRLLDSEAEDLSVDRYGPDLVVSSLVDLRANQTATLSRETAAALQVARHLGERLHARSVYLKLRPRQANTVVDANAAGLAPELPVFGVVEPTVAGDVVQENGLRFRVKLGSGLGTGIYLDQRDNRRWVLHESAGKRVLNTFAYTCAFSVAAAAGGAARTVSIDAAASALDEGRFNLELNGFDDTERHDLIRGDVFHWLPRLSRRGDRFDLLILDPPSYSRVKNRRFRAEMDYGELVATTLALLAPGGTLLACTNCAAIDRKRFHQMVLDGAHLAGRRVATLQHRPASLDHPGGRMKSLVAVFD